MAIRLQTPGSTIYHLQAGGHTYWLTRCSRAWHSPAFTDDDGCCWERVDIMCEIKEAEASKLNLCKKCKRDWATIYAIELLKFTDAEEGGE